MFTGIVRKLGTVARNSGGRLVVSARLGRLPRGASVAVNGVCLTVAGRRASALAFDVGPETLERTNLGSLKAGDDVNLETALKASDFVGGHWVSGHVDSRAEILEKEPDGGGFARLRVRLPETLADLVAVKGSVALDGASLTVTRTGGGFFEVMLVPHTLERTTLGSKGPGDVVNLEADLMARYVRNILKNGAV